MIEIFKKLMRLLDCFAVRSTGICKFENLLAYVGKQTLVYILPYLSLLRKQKLTCFETCTCIIFREFLLKGLLLVPKTYKDENKNYIYLPVQNISV